MSALLKIVEDAKFKRVSAEEMIYRHYQNHRFQQRQMAAKLTDYEIEDYEIKVVMKALSEVDPDRKCFRLIGGFLYEKTVKDVLPALEKRRIELVSLMDAMKKKLTDKMHELAKFKDGNRMKFHQLDRSLLKTNVESEAEPGPSSRTDI